MAASFPRRKSKKARPGLPRALPAQARARQSSSRSRRWTRTSPPSRAARRCGTTWSLYRARSSSADFRSLALWFLAREAKPSPGERYSIAPSAKEFWDKTHTVRNDPKHPEHERLWQFLRRALLSTARIATPQDLALYLASYAREARARIEIAPMGTLEPVKNALSDALGVRFEGEKGVHFFQSTLIQTLFYGIFSAWVLWHEEHSKTSDRFQWRLSAQYLGLPILRTLFVQLAGDPKKVRALHPGGGSRLDGGLPRPRGPHQLLRPLRHGRCRAVFL